MDFVYVVERIFMKGYIKENEKMLHLRFCKLLDSKITKNK